MYFPQSWGAEALFRDGLCLPSGAAMSETDLARVVEVVRLLYHWYSPTTPAVGRLAKVGSCSDYERLDGACKRSISVRASSIASPPPTHERLAINQS